MRLEGLGQTISLNPATGFSSTTAQTIAAQTNTPAANLAISCPSLEQLWGVVDPNDPCQETVAEPGTTGAGTASLLPSSSTVSSPSSINTTLLIAGFAVAILLIAARK
jgi:hypothetical protein